MFSKQRQRCAPKRESGVIWAEAAITIPLFMLIMFSAVYILFFFFKVIRFQYDVADVARTTFSSPLAERGTKDWQSYLTNTLDQRASGLGLETIPSQYAEVSFSGAASGTAWAGASSARPGDLFSIVITLSEPVIPGSFLGISVPDFKVQTKAVAVVQMRQSE
ncbi:MAG: hypothetical protein ACK5Y6_03655 [Pseudomonadota bacterium]|jgi:hypothetical protein